MRPAESSFGPRKEQSEPGDHLNCSKEDRNPQRPIGTCEKDTGASLMGPCLAQMGRVTVDRTGAAPAPEPTATAHRDTGLFSG